MVQREKSRIESVPEGDDRRARPMVPRSDPVYESPVNSPIDAVKVDVEERIRRAGVTLRQIPMPSEYYQLRGGGAAWPDVIQMRHDHGAWNKAPSRPAAPSQSDYQNIDLVLDWIMALDRKLKPAVVGKMFGFGFRRIAKMDPEHRSHETIRRQYNAGIAAIASGIISQSAI